MARKLKKIIVPDSQGNPVEYEVDGVDASTASEGQVLTADGQGGADWGDILVESVPTNVRRAIYDMLSDISDDEANLAIVDQWVQNSIITSLKLTPTSLSFNGLETKRITAKATPATADISGLTWESSNTNVATVSNGAVTSVRNGSCTITASISGITASCSVTVTGIVYPALDSYGDALLASAIAQIDTLNPDGDKLVFGLLSDEHRSHDGIEYNTDVGSDSDRYSLKLLARLANAGKLDFVVNGGDMANGHTDNSAYLQECIEAVMDDIADYYTVPVYSTVGNHDKRYATSNPINSNAYLGTQIRKGIKTKTGHTVTWIDSSNYYIDISGYSNPIRLVVINEYDNIEEGSSASASTAANCTGAWIPAATVGTATHNISAANAATTILGLVYHGATYAQIKATAEAYIEAGGYAVLGSFGGHWHNYSYSSVTDGFNDFLVTCAVPKTSSELGSANEYGVSVFVVDLDSADIEIKWIWIGRDAGVHSYQSLKPVPSEGILRAGTTTKWLNSYTINVSNNNANVEIPSDIKKYSTANLSKVSADVGGSTPSPDTDEVLFSVAAGDSIKTVVYFETGPTALNTENYYPWRLYTGSFSTYLISGKLTTSMAGQTYENTITVDDDYDIYCIMLYWAGQSGHTTNPLKFKVSIYTQASGSDEWVLRTMDNKPSAA